MTNRADNNDDSQSANDGTGHHSGGQKLQFSPVTAPLSHEDNGDNDVDALNANYKNPTAASVEENISVLPQSLLRPPTPEDTTKKHNCERPSQGIRTNNAKVEENDGGLRLFHTNSLPTIEGRNNGTCLLDSILQITPPTKNRELVQLAISSSMPKEGDTTIKNIRNTLADNGLILERVGAKYIRKGRGAISPAKGT